jgi:membrane protease YdiL (CAAX protease family)
MNAATSPATRVRRNAPTHRVLAGFAARHPLIIYFALAYAFSWVVAIPLAASAQGWVSWSLPPSLHYLTGYGPLLAAFITVALVEGKSGVRDLVRRMTQWRARPAWWFVALSPIVLYGLAVITLRVLRGTWSDPGVLGRLNFLPDLGVGAFLLWLVTFGLGEEPGWRGFALPTLQHRHSALTATLILAAFWICWHLPSFLYLGTYMKLGLSVLPMFSLGIAAGAIVLTWLFNGSGGSVLLTAVAHASLNFVTASPDLDPAISAIISTAVMVWAVVVVVVWKPANLSRAPRQVRGSAA